MKTKRICVGAIVVIGLGCLGAPAYSAPRPRLAADIPGEVDEARELKREISLLNLLNGLYLSQQQLDALIPLAERATELHEAHLTRLTSEAEGYSRELMTLRDALYSTTGTTAEQKERALSWERRVELEPRDRTAEALGRIEDQARQILSDGQIAIIEGFKPCLIPPKDLADPIAVGQASTTGREEVALDVVRRMPESLYAARREAIAEAIVRFVEREKGAMPADVRSAMLDTYLEKLDEVRGLSAVDFELRKRELAEAFQPFDDDVTYHRGHTRELGNISRYFLDRQAAEILKRWRRERAADLPETPVAAAVDTDSRSRREQREDRGIRHYGRMVVELVRERSRMGSLGWDERRDLEMTLEDVRDLSSPEKQFAALAEIADRLNERTVTRLSARSMMAQVVGLAHIKRVPGIVGRRRGPVTPIDDVTGLGRMVAEAHQQMERGRTQEAYASLAKVAATLNDFAS
ncbi:MAG: hypothetical protein GY856_03260 [bacterium]|nr:hypothetical protein [bacterium]